MGDHRTLLASDMDGTVIPLEVNPEREKEIAFFADAVDSAKELTLAYVTGRDLPLALKGIQEFGLPVPETLVCDVGTSVYHRTPAGFQKDEDYVRLMEDARGGVDVRVVRHELAQIPNLLLQPEERQTESKLSYHLPPESDHQTALGTVHEILDRLQGPFQAVYSVGAPSGTGLLDLLPAGVAKDFAILYLQKRMGLAPDNLVYAGDSGNDLAAMLAGFNAIVVGNATPGLKEDLLARGEGLGILDRLYFSEGFYAAGVMEGCRHFGIM